MANKPRQNEKEMPMLPDGANVLSKTALKSLLPYAREVSYPAGTTIVRRGDSGSAFYLIISGRVEVILGEGECRLPLARLEEGASFGEMSLLTQVPVSADVATLTAATLLMIPAERFQDALAASAPLRNHIFARLCNNLRRTSSEAWDLFQHTQALSSLMHIQDSDEPIICESAAMAHTKKQIDEMAGQSLPILITGEAGTGKFFVARKIHRAIARQDEPFIILDCQQIGENQADKMLFGAQQVQEFTRRDSQPGGSDLQVQGALHLADKGSIVLRHIESLEVSAQKTLYLYLDALARLGDIFPQARVIATTSEDLTILAQSGRFHPQLAEQLAGNALNIPPLRKRKHDILPLAELFLTSGRPQNGKSTPHLTKSAEHALLSGRYQHRNVAELREAVELAASFAEGGQIDAEHIFTGPKNQGHPVEYDLTRNRLVQWLTKSSSLRLLQGMVLTMFSAIIFFCLVAGATLTGRVANTLVWATWWPALLILFLFVGRVWCTVCPISAAGRIFRLLGSLKLTPPAWIKNYTGWIMALLFLIIMWAEHVFYMTHTPFATAILLLSLMLLAILFCVIFQREMWCRYLCPLGSMAASYSVCSTVQVHANPDVCASQCTSHDCFKGSGTESGCPVYHHPLYARNAHFCKLCFRCLRSCPHQSARIYLRPPLQNLWRLGELGKDLAPFALVVFFLSIVMLSSHKPAWNATVGGFTVLAGLSVVLAFILGAGLARLFANGHDPALTYRVAFGLLILAWGPFMAFHLHDIPELDAILIQAADGSVLSSILNTTPISLLFILQFAVVALAAVCTAICFWRIRVRQADYDGKTNSWPWRFIAALCIVYLSATIALILPGGMFS
ncbi:MAG: sigma 54-interacting transcriptional regulator [Planctomycetota bacterium]|jgi:transcriptional regulator with AAA-type ATPase domain